MSILKTINSPADLKRVPVEQLPVLAEEIREQIISLTSAVGGHLSSNLGVVELTLALHYLLDTPKDKIVWDTGNQAYAQAPDRSARAVPHAPAVRRDQRLLQARGEHLRYVQCGPRRHRRFGGDGDGGGAGPGGTAP